MPTGTCRYPQHHGPSAGPPAGLVAALACGALIIAAWHVVVVVLAVSAVLAVAGACVLLLVHSHRAEPYDASWTGPEAADVPQPAAAEALQARVAQLELQLADRPAIEAPQQHLHLHGVTAADIAAVLAQRDTIDSKEIRP